MTMLHLLRLTCLLTSLGAGWIAWVYHAKPEWIQAVDSRLTAEHLSEIHQLAEDVQAPEWDGDLQFLRVQLETFSSVQLGDRRFPVWSDLVKLLVAGLWQAGELDSALEWQRLLVDKNPRDPVAERDYIELLTERRRDSVNPSAGPPDLEIANMRMKALRERLPDWGKELLPIELELAGAREDWSTLVERLIAWRASGTELSKGWQWFARYKTQGGLMAFPRVDASPATDEAGNVIFNRYRLELEIPVDEVLIGLRLDPPGVVGALRSLRVEGTQSRGGTTGLTGTHIPIDRVINATWDKTLSFIRLYGSKDPQLRFQAPLPSARRVVVEFQADRDLPDWVWAKARSTPELASMLADEGWKPSPTNAVLGEGK